MSPLQVPNPIIAAVSYPPIPLRLAAGYGGPRAQTRNIVIHCTAGSEALTAAENTADWFKNPNSHVSAHEEIDGNSIVRSVPLDLIAYHCGHTGNSLSIGLEICGLATQTREQWLDALSLPALQLAARRCAELCKLYGIPAVYVDYTGLQRCTPGITTHLDVSRAWKQSNHGDPGPGFPLADFVEAVRICVATLP